MILGIRQYQVLKHLRMHGPKTSGDFQHLPILRNTVFSILVGLEGKDYVTSEFSQPERKRGGKAKRVFDISDEGIEKVCAFETHDLKL